MVRALGLFKDSKLGERGMDSDGLLDDGTWPRETRLRAVTSAESWIGGRRARAHWRGKGGKHRKLDSRGWHGGEDGEERIGEGLGGERDTP